MADNEYFRIYPGYVIDVVPANEVYPPPTGGGSYPSDMMVPNITLIKDVQLDRPFVGQIGTKESSTSSTNYFDTYFFEADETTDRYYASDMVAAFPDVNYRWDKNNQVALNQKTFNRLVQNLWFRPTAENKTVNLIDLNRDYITNKNTVLTYLSSPSTTVEFIETGEVGMPTPSFNCFELTYPYPGLGNKIILNESIKDVKKYLPIFYSSWGDWFGAPRFFNPFFEYNNYNVRENTPSQTQVQNDSQINYCNTWNNYITIPDSFDMSKIYFNTLGCYSNWDGANKMFGVSLKIVGRRVYFKYWNRDVGRIYGHYTAKFIPFPETNTSYNWDQVIDRGDGQGWALRQLEMYNRTTYQAIIRIAYFPNS